MLVVVKEFVSGGKEKVEKVEGTGVPAPTPQSPKLGLPGPFWVPLVPKYMGMF